MPIDSLRSLLLAAVRHFAETGFESEADLQNWLIRLHAAIERELPTDSEARRALVAHLQRIYARDIQKMGIAKLVPGVTRYTVDRVQPHLRAELDRRIFASMDLIRLNKAAATAKTLQRFSGWLSSVPKGGAAQIDRREILRRIVTPVKQIRYEARRVAIDQAHKLTASIAAVVAKQNGAIGAVWMDRGVHDKSYDARPEHLKRSGKFFLERNSWAVDEGLIARGSFPYMDSIEQPAELPYCSCSWVYASSPGAIPAEALTAKGRLWVKGAA